MRTVTLIVLLLGLVGCKSKPKPVWIDERLEARSERLLWDVLRLSLDRADFAVGSGAEPADRKIESAWMVDASPFKGQGFRRKAHVTYAPAESVTGAWDVRVRIEKEINDSFKGIDLRYADWKAAPDDEAAAKRVMQFARSYLGGGEFEVGRERQGPNRPRPVVPELETQP